MNPQSIKTTVDFNNENPSRSRTFTVDFFSTPVRTVVTSTPAVVRQWVFNLRKNHRRQISKKSLLVGVGVQWSPNFIKGGPSPVAATLQLCVDGDCLIFQLQHATAVPAALRKLLLDDRVTFVGYRNERDKKLLKKSQHGLEVGRLKNLAKKYGKHAWSMQKMAACYLGYDKVVKPRRLGRSTWDALWLSAEQVQYACVDAHVSYLLGKVLLGFPRHVVVPAPYSYALATCKYEDCKDDALVVNNQQPEYSFATDSDDDDKDGVFIDKQPGYFCYADKYYGYRASVYGYRASVYDDVKTELASDIDDGSDKDDDSVVVNDQWPELLWHSDDSEDYAVVLGHDDPTDSTTWSTVNIGTCNGVIQDDDWYLLD